MCDKLLIPVLVGKVLLPLGRALLGEGGVIFNFFSGFNFFFFFSAIFAEFLQRQSLNGEEFLEIKEPYLYPGFREVAVDDHDDSVLHLL